MEGTKPIHIKNLLFFCVKSTVFHVVCEKDVFKVDGRILSFEIPEPLMQKLTALFRKENIYFQLGFSDQLRFY